MARNLTEIQNQIIQSVQTDPILSEANSPSATAIWRLWTRIIAGAIFTLEVLFDRYRKELITTIEELRPHTLRWYQKKALEFQYGRSLPDDSTEYDNTGIEPEDVAQQKIVVQASAEERGGSVIVKIAKVSGDWLGQLSQPEYDAFEAYLYEVKDAGVQLEIVNQEGDNLELEIDVYYDPLILKSNGARIDGTATAPVRNAVMTYLKNLPFNGWLVKAHLVDFLQTVEGVFVPEIRIINAARFDSSTLSSVDIRYQPFAGYLKFANDQDLVINYIAKTTL